ncbi:hypothetical protein OG767_21995 [Micromonospora sp. NBC_01392]|uniref:beta-ketoacyl synthase N-terminal-like domain-containing protein n=1 Tax=Micromonospora sp. NBC_01392 TaxID=2903588 RepID=UPI0032497BCF
MSSTTCSGSPSITAWTAISPFGLGRAALTRALRTGEAAPATRASARLPPHTAHLVPDFDPRALLGRKGTRAMDRVSGLAVVAARDLVAVLGAADDPARTAVVLATAGSTQAMRDFTRSSLRAARPFHVNPAVIPSGVPNCAAGLVAIWHGLTGPNTTISTGRTDALAALSYARRLLDNGRADRVVVGAVEEYSHTRALLETRHDQPENASGAIGEGCALFLLESGASAPNRRPLVDVLHTAHRAFPAAGPTTELRDCVQEALEACDLAPDQVWAVVASPAAGDLGRYEKHVLDGLFGPDATARIPPLSCGDAGSASAALQIAAVLATPLPGHTDVAVIVTAVAVTGTISCAVLRRSAQ